MIPHALRVTSRQRVQTRAAAVAVERARYGCLTVGARTPGATDLQNIGKVLRTHRALQSKPLRIRSIFCPQIPQGAETFAASMLELLTLKWLPSIRQKRLCSVLEISAGRPAGRAGRAHASNDCHRRGRTLDTQYVYARRHALKRIIFNSPLRWVQSPSLLRSTRCRQALPGILRRMAASEWFRRRRHSTMPREDGPGDA